MHALTDYERQYAEEHHALVYRFLHDKGLDINEFYDVVIFAILRPFSGICPNRSYSNTALLRLLIPP